MHKRPSFLALEVWCLLATLFRMGSSVRQKRLALDRFGTRLKPVKEMLITKVYLAPVAVEFSAAETAATPVLQSKLASARVSRITMVIAP